MNMNREQRLAGAFVELAETLVGEFDTIDCLYTLAEHTVELLRADAVGIVLADQRGALRVLASSTEQARVLELFELQNSEGPCFDCYHSGEPVANVDLAEAAERWPRFRVATTEAGYQSVHALPLRLRSQVIGAMNLFCEDRITLSTDDLVIGQALADVATIALLQERSVRRQEVLAEQLQGALNNRILIEQGKGMVAERGGTDVDDAFARMRGYARAHRVALAAVASAVVDGTLHVNELQPG